MQIKTALTYDDVLLVPQKSDIISRQDVNPAGRLTKNILLKTPIVSANMDTVTESKMAIAMALAGGIGFIHRFCSVEYQVKEVERVKRKQNIIIDKPFVVSPKETLLDVKEKIKEYNCKSFLVTDDSQQLMGILTRRDTVFAPHDEMLVEELMTPKNKLITAPHDVTPERDREIMNANKVEKLPLVDDDFKIRGLITATDIAKNYNNEAATKDSKGRLIVGAAVGIRGDYMERVDALVKAETDVIVVDIAHGHSENEILVIKKIKEKYPQVEIVGGNVATAKAALDLIKAGADCIKIGVGPGSTCITRTTTGFGVPQLTAVFNAARVCKKHNIPLIADGGIKQPGDMVKALAAGADTVMLGGQLSGTKETPGPTMTYRGQQFKISRGMASLTAALSRPDAKENADNITPEGVEARVPYRGPMKNIINQYIGGLRSGMSYGNARNISELQANAEFVRITNSGIKESTSHDNMVL